jgi:hypothetical protein
VPHCDIRLSAASNVRFLARAAARPTKADMAMNRILQNLIYKQLRHLPRKRAFVFCVGLSKTGTTSLNDALDILGYNAIHLPPITKVDGKGEIGFDWPWWISKYDAATDLTVAVHYRKLKETFPNSKFIYTQRPEEAWLDSCSRHFTHELAATRVKQKLFFLLELTQAFYGSFLFDRDSYSKAYQKHEKEVLEFFDGDPNFMNFSLTQTPDWGPLCAFLGKPIPTLPFPASNRGRLRPLSES